MNGNSEPRHPILFPNFAAINNHPALISAELSHKSVYSEPREDEARGGQLSLEATYQPGEVSELKISQSNTGNRLQ